MAKRLITRRQIAVLAAGLVGAGLSGCGAVAPAAKVVIEAFPRRFPGRRPGLEETALRAEEGVSRQFPGHRPVLVVCGG